jgi:hypothetical protein
MSIFARSSTSIAASVKASKSGLLTSTHPWSVESWDAHACRCQNFLESCNLLEIQLFKNKFNVEHEFLLGMFRSPEELIFIAVERTARYPHLDRLATPDDMQQAATRPVPSEESNSNFPNRSRLSSSSFLSGTPAAEDMVMVIRSLMDFDAAAEYFMKKK